VVSLEWLEQSVERGMVLDEALYKPTMPVHERGQGAWDRTLPTSPALGKRTRDARDAEPSQALNPFRRKLRRSASTRMGSQSQALWAGITAVSLERQHGGEDDWNEDDTAEQDPTWATTRNRTPASPRKNAPPPVVYQDDALPEADPADPADPADAREPSLPLPSHGVPHHDGIFQGRIVCTHGFDADKTSILRQHLESHGARVLRPTHLNKLPLDDLQRGYFVVPHDVEVDLPSLPERAGSLMTLVTNWWVERCLYGKRLVDPAEDILSRPFARLSVSGFSGLTINATGFSGIELLHVTKVIALMGATYDEQFTAKTSVIVCNPPIVNSAKLKFAADKRIPAVHPTWLWECLSSGRLQSYGEYQLKEPGPPQPRKANQVPQHQDNVPTVPLSDDERVKQRRQCERVATKPQHPQRSRPGTLALAPSADGTPASTTDSLVRSNSSINNLTHHEDEPAIGGMDGAASFPLQPTSANSPRRPSTSSSGSKPFSRPRSSSAESLIKAVPAPRRCKPGRDFPPDSVIPAAAPDSVIPTEDATEPVLPTAQKDGQKETEGGREEEKDYSSILAQLRANRKAAPTPADQADEKRRKRRQLGRATSTRSNASAGDSSGNLLADDDESSVLVEEFQPSQVLGWDEPGAAKAREQMIRKLGGTVKEKSVAVEGIGMVRDVDGETSNRTGRKRRG
ncbi:hypothetical protein BDW02DRAFT_568799, partial [Decorospora gaudefroyi]